MLEIKNNGMKISSTNYFNSESAKQGYVYFSSNGGCVRVLIPSVIESEIKREFTKNYILVLGFHKDFNKEMFELIFDDKTNNPFSLQVSTKQFQTMISAESYEKKWPIDFYSKNLEILCNGKVFLTKVSSIPVSIVELEKIRKKN